MCDVYFCTVFFGICSSSAYRFLTVILAAILIMMVNTLLRGHRQLLSLSTDKL